MKAFRRFVFIVLACFQIIAGVSAENIDISNYTLEELTILQERIGQRIQALEIQDALENGDRLIRFEESELLLYVDQKQKIEPVVVRRTETAPATTTLLWEVEDPAILTVNKGQISPLSVGETIITVKAMDDERIQASIKARVVHSVSSLTLDLSSLQLVLGAQEGLQSSGLSAQLSPADAFHREIVWTSSDEKVAAVDQGGNVQALKAGRAVITAQTNDPSLRQQKKATCSVTVRQAVEEVQLNENALFLGTQKAFRLSASVFPETAAKRGVEWSSSDPAIASVSDYGTVTGKQPGECIITCSAADGYGASASCIVTVARQITKITDAGGKNQTQQGVRVGGEAVIRVHIEPEDATNPSLHWTLSDDSIADILPNEDGTITLQGKAQGRATLTGEAMDGSGQSIEYSITVEGESSVQCTGKVETGEAYGYKWFILEFENTSAARKVDGITIRYYAEDVYGEKIRSYGLGDYEVEETFNLNLAPGTTKKSPKEVIFGFNQAKTLYAGIVKLHYTNGEIVEVSEPEYLRFELPE